MRVLMMPDFRKDNPYQALLAAGLQKRGVEVFFPAGYRRIFPFWRAWRSYPGTSVLHLHWLTPYLRGHSLVAQVFYSAKLLLDVALLRASGVAVVWTIHNRVSHESRWPGLEVRLQRRLAKAAGCVILHAEASLREVRSDLTLPDHKVRIIPHGHYRDVYDSAVDGAAARVQLGLPADGRIYLYFGLLRPYKGIERLIREWRSAVPFQAEAHLVIAGQATDDAFLASLAEAAKDCPTIHIRPGFVPKAGVHFFFSAADVVVLPFQRVLTSGSLLLAMSFGKPVLAPRFGGIAETLGDADDLLYDPADPDALRMGLARSATLPLRPLAAKIEQRCEKLNWESIAASTLEAYRSAAGRAN